MCRSSLSNLPWKAGNGLRTQRGPGLTFLEALGGAAVTGVAAAAGAALAVPAAPAHPGRGAEPDPTHPAGAPLLGQAQLCAFVCSP